jgi:hypothetical protein
MNAMNLKILSSMIALAALNGCATEPAPMLESHFGDAVRAGQAQQTLNPDASKNPDPVAGIDGPSATRSIDRYHKSFDAPPPTFTILNVNGGATR